MNDEVQKFLNLGIKEALDTDHWSTGLHILGLWVTAHSPRYKKKEKEKIKKLSYCSDPLVRTIAKRLLRGENPFQE